MEYIPKRFIQSRPQHSTIHTQIHKKKTHTTFSI